MRLDELRHYQEAEECPYFDRCPLGDADIVPDKCKGFYLQCPRYYNYVQNEIRRIEQNDRKMQDEKPYRHH